MARATEATGGFVGSERALVPQRTILRSGAVMLLLGAVLLVVSVFLNRGLAVEGEGAVALFQVFSHPNWIPLKAAETVGLLFVALGLVTLLRVVYPRGNVTLVGAAAGALVIALLLQVLEFVIAAIAAPALLADPLGTGLTDAEIGTLFMGYQAVGIGLLSVARLTFAIAFLLIGIALYRTHTYHPFLGIVGMVVGGLLTVNYLVFITTVIDLAPLSALSFPAGPVPFLLLVVWLVALGAFMLRAPPAAVGE